MSNDDLSRLWADPRNWTPVGLYRCEADPRTWVLKRPPGVGYTINVAHSRSWIGFLAVLAVALAPTVASVILGRGAPSWLLLVQLLVPIAVVVGLLIWLSSRDRA